MSLEPLLRNLGLNILILIVGFGVYFCENGICWSIEEIQTKQLPHENFVKNYVF